jgi:hypothetical protein
MPIKILLAFFSSPFASHMATPTGSWTSHLLPFNFLGVGWSVSVWRRLTKNTWAITQQGMFFK